MNIPVAYRDLLARVKSGQPQIPLSRGQAQDILDFIKDLLREDTRKRFQIEDLHTSLKAQRKINTERTG